MVNAMTIRNLEFLLNPRSVALIGAGTRPGSVGLITARNLLSGGFSGPVWLVNPKHESIEGRRCYPSVGALPAAPDLAVIVTPPQTVPQLIRELGEKGTRAAVVITAGVRGDLKAAMLEASRPYLLRVQGPNCLGLMLPRIGLNASFSNCAPLPGDLAFVSQSGALITAILDWARGRSIGFSHVVSLGDMADADFGDLLDYLAGDVQSRAILLYMESVTNAPKFMSAARRAARSKPVIIVKAGRSATGAKAALSHTGALAGADAAYEAAFRRAGLLRVRELTDLFSAAEILARHPQLGGERLAILTNGGGAGVLAADRLSDLGGTLSRISDGTRSALDAVLPATWSHGNPIDIIGDADAARYGQALQVLLERDDADAVLVMNCPTALASSTEVAAEVATVTDRHKASSARPKAVITAWLGDEASREARKLFAQKGIGSFATPSEAIDGFMQLVHYARAQEELMRTPPSLPAGLDVDKGKAAAAVQSVLADGRTTLSEIEAKELLAAYGIPVVPTFFARDPTEVGERAALLLGQHAACAIKVVSDDISHKSDVGGVRLGLERAGDAQQAAADMLQRISRLLPDARIKGFSVQPMISRPRAHELILGMSVDQAFGPLLMFGAGGTGVEVMRDTAHGLPPLDLKLARDLMRQTRIWQLLQGYRDRPAAAMDAIAEALVRLELPRDAPSADPRDRHQPPARRRTRRHRPRRPRSRCRPDHPAPRSHGCQALPGRMADRHGIARPRGHPAAPDPARGRDPVSGLLRQGHLGRSAPALLHRRAEPLAPLPGADDPDRLRARDGIRGDHQGQRRLARRRAPDRRSGLYAGRIRDPRQIGSKGLRARLAPHATLDRLCQSRETRGPARVGAGGQHVHAADVPRAWVHGRSGAR